MAGGGGFLSGYGSGTSLAEQCCECSIRRPRRCFFHGSLQHGPSSTQTRPSSTQTQKLLETYDDDRSGTIEFPEFRRLCEDLPSIVGRDKDLIISGGLNVYPKEVEGMIDDIDGVLESAVIGVPHRDFGEAVVAVVVREDDGLEAATLEGALSSQLAKFKQPKAVLFTNALPRNSMGKVQKAELRKAHAGLFS